MTTGWEKDWMAAGRGGGLDDDWLGEGLDGCGQGWRIG